MRFLPLALLLLWIPPTRGSAAAATPPGLRFEGMPLGNVVRIIGARMRAPISIAENAAAPVTGDFSALEPAAALKEAARQAGLVVVAAGTDAGAGFSLVRPAAAAAADDASARRQALDGARRRREALLRKQAALTADASRPDR